MARIKRAQCFVCCKMYDTREEADACTHEPVEPDIPPAALVVSIPLAVGWGLANKAKRNRQAKRDEALAQHHAPPPAPTPAAAEADPAERLKKLADLHQSGLLTDEEWAAKRAAIVDQL